MESTELMHYGVKGMKWGIRKQRASPESAKRDKTNGKTEKPKTSAKDKAKKGAKTVTRVLNKVGKAYIADQLFFDGMGTKACKAAIRVVGMATITAVKMAGGAYDIKWYDKAGNRVG